MKMGKSNECFKKVGEKARREAEKGCSPAEHLAVFLEERAPCLLRARLSQRDGAGKEWTKPISSLGSVRV